MFLCFSSSVTLFSFNYLCSKMAILPINQIGVEPYKKPKEKQCLCESLRQLILMCRLFGLLPISCTGHKNGIKKFNQEDAECHFYVSKFWKGYTIFLIFFHCGGIYASYYYNTTTCIEGCSIRMLSQWIYLSCGILLSLFGILNGPIFVETLNGVGEFLRLGLFCDGSKKSLRRFIFYGNILGLTQLTLQIALKFYILLKYTDEKGSLLFHVFTQIDYNIPFIFYFLFCGLIFFYVTLLNCFEKFFDITLNDFKPRSELKPPGVLDLNLCCQIYHHDLATEGRDFFENADFVRRLHERIRSSLLRMNRALNPQILIQVSVELLVIVMHLYTIIVYNTSQEAIVTQQRFMENCLDSLFTIAHVLFLILFLFCAQAVKSTVRLLFQTYQKKN